MDPLKMKISIQLILLDLLTNLGALQRTDLCKNETGFQTSFDVIFMTKIQVQK